MWPPISKNFHGNPHHLTAFALTLLIVGCDVKAQNAIPLPELTLELRGNMRQSGAIIGKTLPFANIAFDGENFNADKDGNFVLGFDRDAGATANLTITAPDGRKLERTFDVARRSYRVTNVNGVPAATVNPPQSMRARIAAESARKQTAWSSLDENSRGFAQNFRWPLNVVRVTSSWGAVRRINGTLTRPHYGVDLGARTGTPVYAPASGKIVIAERNFFYEGGLVGIDHGQGLITLVMHLSRVNVVAGRTVEQGEKIGEVGATGRSTGPHLHWGMRWRGRQLDPSLMVRPLAKIE